MTPLLTLILKLPEASSFVKIEPMEEAQKIQEVYYVTDDVSPNEDVREHEETVEEHVRTSYEDEVVLPQKAVESDRDIVTSKERDKLSELRGRISVSDSDKKKETWLTKQKLVPKPQEATVIEKKKSRDVLMPQDRPVKEKSKKEFFVKKISSPAEEISEPDTKDETSAAVRKQREIERDIKLESKGRKGQKVAQPEATVRERELVTEETKLPFDHDSEISATYSQPDHVTEITIETEEPTKETPAQVGEDRYKEETQVKPPVFIDSKKDRVSDKVSLTRREKAQKIKSDDTKQKIAERLKPKVELPVVQTKESVTDIELKKPKTVQLDSKMEGVSKKGEEPKYTPPQKEEPLIKNVDEPKPSVLSEAAEKKRTSPQTATRGTARKSNITVISIFDLFTHVQVPSSVLIPK